MEKPKGNDCSCIKKEAQAFDFVLNTYDCKALVITDLSNWMTGDSYTIPDKFDVTITLPNQSRVDVLFAGNSTTKIYSRGLTNTECLPDGIYCFSTYSCGYNYERVKAVVCTLRCKLDDLISKSDDYEEITRLENLISSIEVSAELGLEQQAKELFKIADKELSKHSCTCYCK
jgi:hypothetical protein